MSVHKSTREMPMAAKVAGEIIHVANVNFQLEPVAIADAFKEKGFEDCIFYWPENPDPNKKHRGFFFVQFKDHAAADQARTTLSGAELHGRPLKIGRLREVSHLP